MQTPDPNVPHPPDTSRRAFHVQADGVTLAGVEAGPADGHLVLLLHGFPDCHATWQQQIDALAEAGFHAVAPDLRGYGDSSKPPRVSDYRIEQLVADVVALIEHFDRSGQGTTVVGHDWGGIIAWYAAMRHPQRLSRLVILNAPHPLAYFRELRRGWSQRLRSGYVLFFQLPWLPEFIIRWNDFAILRRLYRTVHRDNKRHAMLHGQKCVEALSRPRALTSAINYYRAAFRRSPATLARLTNPTDVPTLIVWGEKDPYLVSNLTENLAPWVTNLRVARLPDAGHWVHHDAAARVNTCIIDFLNDPQVARPNQATDRAV